MAETEAHKESHEPRRSEPTLPAERPSLLSSSSNTTSTVPKVRKVANIDTGLASRYHHNNPRASPSASSTQPSGRGKVPAANKDKQIYEESSALQEFDFDEHIQWPKAQLPSNGGFQWITGTHPDDFKTKDAMQTIRQAAMSSYLMGARKMAESRTSVGSQDASKPQSSQSSKGKGKRTSELQTPSKATWKTTRPSVEDVIDGSSMISTTSDPMESVFSAESSGTSMTVFSQGSTSGFSREQVQTATRVFVSVIQSDQILGPIYKSARNDPTVGPSKLRSYVRATLKAYAENLKTEAKDHLEHTASKLVRVQAGHAARCVSSDNKFTHGPMKDSNDSSDDEFQEQPVDERQFDDDLDAFRSFLTQSNAFAILRDHTQLFFSYQPIITAAESSETHFGEDIPEHTEGGRSGKGLIRTFKDTVMFMIINILVSLECLEPPLETDWTRIKIECHTCGERSFDDVLEHCEGGIAQLKQWMERALNATITVVHPNEEAASTHGRWHSPALAHNILRGLQRIFRRGKPRTDPVLPEHNGPQLESEPRRAKSPSPQRSSLQLMSCVHRNWEHRILLQDRVDHINTDREFFTFLKTQVRKRRSRVMRILSCRKIQAIHFTMFRLRMGNRLEVRDHRDCCKASCNCLPPRDHPDYDFACPLDSTYPVIPPRAFAHMLKHTR